jgi:hypothetical protein
LHWTVASHGLHRRLFDYFLIPRALAFDDGDDQG